MKTSLIASDCAIELSLDEAEFFNEYLASFSSKELIRRSGFFQSDVPIE